jgi:hypothetical protein
VLDSLEKLYSLGVLDGLGQQELKLKDELLDKYVFCQTVREATGFRIAVEKKLLASTVTSRMRRAGQITGFEQVMKPYCRSMGSSPVLGVPGLHSLSQHLISI